MDVQTRSALIITLVASSAASASDFHESLRADVICSSEANPTKLEILENPASDGFFNVSGGLCKALPMDSEEPSTLFPVAHCMMEEGQQFSFMFGGWLNMLTIHFEQKSEEFDLFCR